MKFMGGLNHISDKVNTQMLSSLFQWYMSLLSIK